MAAAALVPVPVGPRVSVDEFAGKGGEKLDEGMTHGPLISPPVHMGAVPVGPAEDVVELAGNGGDDGSELEGPATQGPIISPPVQIGLDAAVPVGPAVCVVELAGKGGVGVVLPTQGPAIEPPVQRPAVGAVDELVRGNGAEDGGAVRIGQQGPSIDPPEHVVVWLAAHGPVISPPVQIVAVVFVAVVDDDDGVVATHGPVISPPVQIGEDEKVSVGGGRKPLPVGPTTGAEVALESGNEGEAAAEAEIAAEVRPAEGREAVEFAAETEAVVLFRRGEDVVEFAGADETGPAPVVGPRLHVKLVAGYGTEAEVKLDVAALPTAGELAIVDVVLLVSGAVGPAAGAVELALAETGAERETAAVKEASAGVELLAEAAKVDAAPVVSVLVTVILPVVVVVKVPKFKSINNSGERQGNKPLSYWFQR